MPRVPMTDNEAYGLVQIRTAAGQAQHNIGAQQIEMTDNVAYGVPLPQTVSEDQP